MTTLAETEGAIASLREIINQTYGTRFAEPKVDACVAMVTTHCANWEVDNVFGALDRHISNSEGTPPPGNFLPTRAEMRKQVQGIFQDDLRQRKQEHTRQYHAESEATSAAAIHKLWAAANEEVAFHEKRKRLILSAVKKELGLNFLHEDLSIQRLHCAAYYAVNREYQRLEAEEKRHMGFSEAVDIAREVIDSSGVAAAEYKRGGGPPYSGGEPWVDNPFSQRAAAPD